MAPIVDGLTDEYEDRVAVRKYNVAESAKGAALAEEFGVQFVPTFVFVDSEGELVDMLIGEVAESALRAALDDIE